MPLNKKKNSKTIEKKKRLQKEIDLIIKKAEEQNKVISKLIEANKKK